MASAAPSSTTLASVTTALPEPQPEDPGARLFLFAVRQIGAHGLNDACTAQAFLTAFGRGFRRPLLLTRALMAEMSSTASGPIRIAPWCCGRITGAEATLLNALARAIHNPASAGLLLADLLGVRRADNVLSIAQAVAQSFADEGLPFE